MGCRLVMAVVGMVAVSSSRVWAEDGDSAPSDSDLMFEALQQWRGESPSDSAAVDRLLAAAKRESRRRQASIRRGATSTYFRDPFADDPEALIPVRKEDRDLLDNLRAGSRASADVVAARAEAAAARSDAAAARADAERAERRADRAEALAARRETRAGEAGCADTGDRDQGSARQAADALDSTPSQESASVPPSARRVRRVRSHRRQSHDVSALGGAIAGAEGARPSGTQEQLPPAGADDSPTGGPPAGWTSADSRGILVVPIEASISQARRSAHLH